VTRTYPLPPPPADPDNLEVLDVAGRSGSVHYHIEPARFELGYSRVQMVDDHLVRVCADGGSRHPDVDVLLDARALFTQATADGDDPDAAPLCAAT